VNGKMLKLRYYGDPILRKQCEPVNVFDDELKRFIDELKETMRENDGAGLAANQVGKYVRCIVIDPSGEGNEAVAFINPEFTYMSDDKIVHEEGCLSFPDLHMDVTRSEKVSVKAFDENGHEFVIENAEGLLSRALQHEIDHLNGLYIIDHISLLQRKLLKGKLKEISEMNFSETALSDEKANAF
jgi:peptide deformylase